MNASSDRVALRYSASRFSSAFRLYAVRGSLWTVGVGDSLQSVGKQSIQLIAFAVILSQWFSTISYLRTSILLFLANF